MMDEKKIQEIIEVLKQLEGCKRKLLAFIKENANVGQDSVKTTQ